MIDSDVRVPLATPGRYAPERSYLVCALPRSGGRLLAASLRTTGVVAPPEPRFWHGWRGHEPCVRQLLRRDPTTPSAALTYEGIRAAGAGPRGTFGAEVQWPELERLIGTLGAARGLPGGPPADFRAPCPGRAEHELLRSFLPGLRYVHLTREDKAAQAVAWWRARHARDCTSRPAGAGRDRNAGGPVAEIDPAEIEQLERRLRADEWRWVSYFARAGVEPLVVSYEALTEDHTATVHRVLEYLDVPDARTVPVLAPHDAAADGVDRAQVDAVRRRRRRPTVDDDTLGPDTTISIVVTRQHPADDLDAAVGAVRAGVPEDVELVVVDDRSAFTGDGHERPALPGVLVIHDPSAPAGPAAARNLGAARAGGDLLVFLDARARPRPGWLAPLRAALAEPAVAVVGPAVVDRSGGAPTAFGLTWQDPLLHLQGLERRPGAATPVPFVPGCCMAFRRRDFEAVGGFDVGMVASGTEDAEVCLHLWRRGRLCLVVPAAEVEYQPPVEGVAPDVALYNALRLATMHFGPDTLLRTFDQATAREAFPQVYRRLVNSDVFERRRRVVAASTHDDAWFLDRFGIEALR